MDLQPIKGVKVIEYESIVYRGVEYRRYPNSPNRSLRKYYVRVGKKGGGETLLHRAIYADIHGPIAPGYDIHHRDENPLNNQPDNLEALTAEEHARLHGLTEYGLRRIAQARAAKTEGSNAWLKTEEGLAHVRRMRELANELKHTRICQHCGNEFLTSDLCRNRAKYCHENCQKKAKRKRDKLKRG